RPRPSPARSGIEGPPSPSPTPLLHGHPSPGGLRVVGRWSSSTAPRCCNCDHHRTRGRPTAQHFPESRPSSRASFRVRTKLNQATRGERMTVDLWPHQKGAIDATLSAINFRRQSGLWVMPTGTGKTRVFLTLARQLGDPTLIVVHR